MIPLLLGLALAAAPDAPETDAPTAVTGHAGQAYTLGRGHGIVGVFRPISIGVSDRVDLSTSGLATLVAPRLDVKVNLVNDKAGAVAATGGVGVPTAGLRLLRGTALPSDPTLTIGFGVVAKLGLIATLTSEQGSAMSLGAEVRTGAHGGTLETVDLPFLSQSLAPLLEGPVIRWRWVTDLALSKRTTLTSDLALQVGAGGPDAVWRTFLLGGSDHVAAGIGWAIADENLMWGRDSLGMPLLDVQARW